MKLAVFVLAACPSCAGNPQNIDTFKLVLGLMMVPVVVLLVLAVKIGLVLRSARKVTVSGPATATAGQDAMASRE